MSKQSQGSILIVAAIAGGIGFVAFVALMVVGGFSFSPAAFLAIVVAAAAIAFLFIGFHERSPRERPDLSPKDGKLGDRTVPAGTAGVTPGSAGVTGGAVGVPMGAAGGTMAVARGGADGTGDHAGTAGRPETGGMPTVGQKADTTEPETGASARPDETGQGVGATYSREGEGGSGAPVKDHGAAPGQTEDAARAKEGDDDRSGGSATGGSATGGSDTARGGGSDTQPGGIAHGSDLPGGTAGAVGAGSSGSGSGGGTAHGDAGEDTASGGALAGRNSDAARGGAAGIAGNAEIAGGTVVGGSAADAATDAGAVATGPAPDTAPATTAGTNGAPDPTVGKRPPLRDAPREGGADDLKRIKGVGPKLEDVLHGLGVYHYDQIAAWSDDELDWIDEHLEGFRGRARRDDWIAQAGRLARGEDAGDASQADRGDAE